MATSSHLHLHLSPVFTCVHHKLRKHLKQWVALMFKNKEKSYNQNNDGCDYIHDRHAFHYHKWPRLNPTHTHTHTILPPRCQDTDAYSKHTAPSLILIHLLTSQSLTVRVAAQL